MTFNPTNYTTWNAFGDHPIFGLTKSNITDWSLDPSRYCELKYYGQFMPNCYVHIDPVLPVDEQLKIASHDITNLALACAQIEQTFGQIKYELVILNDFTVYVWIQHQRFSIEIYPNNFPDEDGIMTVFIDLPNVNASEHTCGTVATLTKVLHDAIDR